MPTYSIDPDILLMFTARILAYLIAIPIHESAHAFVSYKLGDPTARNLGRISLNPAKHFDLLGALFMLLLGFGWAKPVPVNTAYYANKKYLMAVSSLAGPISNFILAFILMIIYKVIYIIFLVHPASVVLYWVVVILQYMITINIILTIFNLLPVPPLDGSGIFLIFLPERIYFGIIKYERYLMIGFFLLVSSGILAPFLTQLQIAICSLLDRATSFMDILYT